MAIPPGYADSQMGSHNLKDVAPWASCLDTTMEAAMRHDDLICLRFPEALAVHQVLLAIHPHAQPACACLPGTQRHGHAQATFCMRPVNRAFSICSKAAILGTCPTIGAYPCVEQGMAVLLSPYRGRSTKSQCQRMQHETIRSRLSFPCPC